ncbi:MAG: hypothetical protein BJ554DRAFT_3216, partial [Olpidium bornovanus]
VLSESESRAENTADGVSRGFLADDAVFIVVRSEADASELVNTRIIKDDIYQRQQDTLIVWTEPSDGRDLALSFENIEGCFAVWHQICEIQRILGGKPNGQHGSGAAHPTSLLARSRQADMSQTNLFRTVPSRMGMLEVPPPCRNQPSATSTPSSAASGWQPNRDFWGVSCRFPGAFSNSLELPSRFCGSSRITSTSSSRSSRRAKILRRKASFTSYAKL